MNPQRRRDACRCVLICPVCGNAAVIWRRRGRLRPAGHLKHLWCWRCQEVTPHTEVGQGTQQEVATWQAYPINPPGAAASSRS